MQNLREIARFSAKIRRPARLATHCAGYPAKKALLGSSIPHSGRSAYAAYSRNRARLSTAVYPHCPPCYPQRALFSGFGMCISPFTPKKRRISPPAMRLPQPEPRLQITPCGAVCRASSCNQALCKRVFRPLPCVVKFNLEIGFLRRCAKTATAQAPAAQRTANSFRENAWDSPMSHLNLVIYPPNSQKPPRRRYV